MRQFPPSIVLGALFVWSCAERYASLSATDVAPLPCDAPVHALSLFPAEVVIDAGPARSSTVAFAALASLSEDGADETLATWASFPAEVGTIGDDGTWVASGNAGGEVVLAARANGHVATSRLIVRLSRDVFIGVGEGVRDVFAPDRPRTGTQRPRWLSPLPGDRIPWDESAFEFRWDGAGHDRFRLVFQSATSAVAIHTAAESMVFDADVASTLARATRGRSVQVLLEATSAGDELVHRAAAALPISFCLGDEYCDGNDDDCDDVPDEACIDPAEQAEGALSPREGACP